MVNTHLASTFNSLLNGSHLSRDPLLAYITVIPKEGKELVSCSSYCLLSLLNIDLKLWKISADVLIHHAGSLIDLDQASSPIGWLGTTSLKP